MENQTDHLNEEDIRLQKCQTLRDQGHNPYTHNFKRSHDIQTVASTYATLNHGDPCEETVTIAGRLMAKRGHGKATFGNVEDESGAIQYYGKVDLLGEDVYTYLLSFDVGDIIGITGTPFVSQRGELTLRIQTVTLLTKALHPLPEKFHGLQDKETRYRQRYVDLIANRDVKNTFKTRSKIVQEMRTYLHQLDFMEVETPILHSIYGGASARPFITHHNELGQDLYLRIATELHLKRLIVGGYEKVFEIGRIFRNEGVSYKHNPEFTSIELYQAYADYDDIMTLTENIISHLIQHVHGSTTINYQGTELNFATPFKRQSMDEALLEYASISIHASDEELRKKAASLGLDNAKQATRGQLITHIFDETVEGKLVQPTFIVDYPWETSPLAKRKRGDESLVERFELFVHTMELANAFSELNDPIDQHDRFVDQLRQQEAGDDEAQQMDDDYVTALKYGMPPTGGLGIGIDRLVMLATDNASIRDVIFFPHMKTKA